MLSMFKDKKGFSALFKREDAELDAGSSAAYTAGGANSAALGNIPLTTQRCQRCSKNFRVSPTAPRCLCACPRCEYPICRRCREKPTPASRAADGCAWLCCSCNRSPTLMRLLEDTKQGRDLTARIIEYCDPRAERIMKSFFRPAALMMAAQQRQRGSSPQSHSRSRGRTSAQLTSLQRVKAEMTALRREDAAGNYQNIGARKSAGKCYSDPDVQQQQALSKHGHEYHHQSSALQQHSASSANQIVNARVQDAKSRSTSTLGAGVMPLRRSDEPRLSHMTRDGVMEYSSEKCDEDADDEEEECVVMVPVSLNARSMTIESTAASASVQPRVSHAHAEHYCNEQQHETLRATISSWSDDADTEDGGNEMIVTVEEYDHIGECDEVRVSASSFGANTSYAASVGASAVAAARALSFADGLLYAPPATAMSPGTTTAASAAAAATTVSNSTQPAMAARPSGGGRPSGMAAFEREVPASARTLNTQEKVKNHSAMLPAATVAAATTATTITAGALSMSLSPVPRKMSTGSGSSSGSGRSESPAPRFPSFTEYLGDQALAAHQQCQKYGSQHYNKPQHQKLRSHDMIVSVSPCSDDCELVSHKDAVDDYEGDCTEVLDLGAKPMNVRNSIKNSTTPARLTVHHSRSQVKPGYVTPSSEKRRTSATAKIHKTASSYRRSLSSSGFKSRSVHATRHSARGTGLMSGRKNVSDSRGTSSTPHKLPIGAVWRGSSTAVSASRASGELHGVQTRQKLVKRSATAAAAGTALGGAHRTPLSTRTGGGALRPHGPPATAGAYHRTATATPSGRFVRLPSGIPGASGYQRTPSANGRLARTNSTANHFGRVNSGATHLARTANAQGHSAQPQRLGRTNSSAAYLMRTPLATSNRTGQPSQLQKFGRTASYSCGVTSRHPYAVSRGAADNVSAGETSRFARTQSAAAAPFARSATAGAGYYSGYSHVSGPSTSPQHKAGGGNTPRRQQYEQRVPLSRTFSGGYGYGYGATRGRGAASNVGGRGGSRGVAGPTSTGFTRTLSANPSYRRTATTAAGSTGGMLANARLARTRSANAPFTRTATTGRYGGGAAYYGNAYYRGAGAGGASASAATAGRPRTPLAGRPGATASSATGSGATRPFSRTASSAAGFNARATTPRQPRRGMPGSNSSSPSGVRGAAAHTQNSNYHEGRFMTPLQRTHTAVGTSGGGARRVETPKFTRTATRTNVSAAAAGRTFERIATRPRRSAQLIPGTSLFGATPRSIGATEHEPPVIDISTAAAVPTTISRGSLGRPSARAGSASAVGSVPLPSVDRGHGGAEPLSSPAARHDFVEATDGYESPVVSHRNTTASIGGLAYETPRDNSAGGGLVDAAPALLHIMRKRRMNPGGTTTTGTARGLSTPYSAASISRKTGTGVDGASSSIRRSSKGAATSTRPSAALSTVSTGSAVRGSTSAVPAARRSTDTVLSSSPFPTPRVGRRLKTPSVGGRSETASEGVFDRLSAPTASRATPKTKTVARKGTAAGAPSPLTRQTSRGAGHR